jgi:hypothetical protein
VEAAKPPAADPLKEDPTVVADDAQFPEPSLYFKVFDSEADEPEAKIRADVNLLYDRWIEKYGRRWPEDGLNTEDMVWLAEEAPGRRRQQRRRKGAPLEVSEYENEFIPEDGEGAAAASASGADGKPGAAGGKAGRGEGASTSGGAQAGGRKPMSNYEATVSGGKWVTDEFESQDYEAGNLEQMWGMYLWDREGKPTMMPDTPAAQQEGEESERCGAARAAWGRGPAGREDSAASPWRGASWQPARSLAGCCVAGRLHACAPEVWSGKRL